MSDIPLAIGVDFGGTTIKIGVVFKSNVIDHAPPIATQEFDGPEDLIAAIARVIEDLRARHTGIAAVGIGVPGFVDFAHGMVYTLTNVRGWVDVRLKATLENLTGLPVTVDNDANCMAFAEWKRGAGRGLTDLVAITMGTGVGGGLVVNNRMVRGSQFGAGEIGQTSVDYRGRVGQFGNIGALEDYIGNQEIAMHAMEAYQAAGQAKHPEECTPAALAHAANVGDEIALAVWDYVAEMLACALMNCCWLLNPQAIVIGGGVARAGDVLFEPLVQKLHAQLSAPFKDHLMVLPARFGNEAGLIGAAALALEMAGHTLTP